MRLIDADKLIPINAPIAGITTGELTHYEKIVFWKTIYDAPTINVLYRVLEIIDKTRFVEETGELTAAWNDACENIKRQVLALKGERDGFNLERRC